MAGEGEHDDILVRTLSLDDLDRLVKIDKEIVGRTRRAWYEGKLNRAMQDADVRISLGAIIDDTLVGAVLGSVHYGEFGLPEPEAVLDTILVDRAYSRRGIARALIDQMLKNLSGLRIERIRTEVAWDDLELVGFLGRMGFRPAPRLVLERVVADT